MRNNDNAVQKGERRRIVAGVEVELGIFLGGGVLGWWILR